MQQTLTSLMLLVMYHLLNPSLEKVHHCSTSLAML